MKFTKILYVPEGTKSIGEYACAGLDGYDAVIIPEGVTSIGKGAFHGCSGLKAVILPDSVTSIGAYAFEHTNATIFMDTDRWPLDKGISLGENTPRHLFYLVGESPDLAERLNYTVAELDSFRYVE